MDDSESFYICTCGCDAISVADWSEFMEEPALAVSIDMERCRVTLSLRERLLLLVGAKLEIGIGYLKTSCTEGDLLAVFIGGDYAGKFEN